MSVDIVVGLLTLLGILYVGWSQIDLRQAETASRDAEAIEFSAEAVRHMTTSLMQAIEALAGRDQLIAELRARIEVLEEHDRIKSNRIAELDEKVQQLEVERQALLEQRNLLKEQLLVMVEGEEGTEQNAVQPLLAALMPLEDGDTQPLEVKE